MSVDPDAAHWVSWADCPEMIKQRHPGSTGEIINGMAVGLGHMRAVEVCGTRLRDGRLHSAMGSTCGRVVATNR